ncbi:MAG: HU family DNA-binding protein [Gemmatimonadaceae bacterium]|nr:HU family DNA-binding protein [Gloeobacterales cyanobacterium ES-bin-141]
MQTASLATGTQVGNQDSLNRQAIIQQMSQRVDGLTQKTAAAALESVLELVGETLAAGRPVHLSGFGSFGLRRRRARTNVHPRTGRPVTVPAAWVPVFTPSRLLRERVQAVTSEEDLAL